MGMGVSGGGRKNEIKPTMNVTPLVDVVLVLLIIFMVVTPLLAKQFWLNLPKKDEEAKQEPPPDEQNKPVVVTVERDGTVRINQSPVAVAELKDKLSRIIAARSESVIYFDAHDEADYGVAVQVMDQARMGGAKTIAVLTENVVR